MESLQERTRYLGYLISNAKQSAADTYEAGRILYDIKNNDSFHPEFKIKGIEELYTNEPIDEQGLVGLFCTIFHIIKGKPFSYKGITIRFSKILYVRSLFPDSKIEITSDEKVDHLNIEFEFYSMNYLRHKHNKQKAECHIIVCWEDNWKTKKNIERPKILSVKKLLNEGEIVLN